MSEMRNYRRKNPFPVEEARKLRDEGWTYQRIADHFGVAVTTPIYHLNPEFKANKMRLQAKYRADGRYKDYLRDYMREYVMDRYNNDEEFRERWKVRSREYQRRRRGVNE